MKKWVVSILAFGMVVGLFTACTAPETPSDTTVTTTVAAATTTTVTTQTVTDTTSTTEVGVGGETFEYAAPYNLYFYLSQSVIDLVPEIDYVQWCNTFEDAGMGGTRNPKDRNVYTFLKEFAIPRASIEEICARYKEVIPDSDYFTKEQVEMLYNGTELEVYQYFANPHAVLVGKYAYPPKWLAENTAAEYAAVGITTAALSEKMEEILSVCTEKEQDHLRTQLTALKVAEETAAEK